MLIDPVPSGGLPTPQVTEPGVFTRSVPEMKDSQD
jgi:NADH-quinone oxidoreductase subunit I